MNLFVGVALFGIGLAPAMAESKLTGVVEMFTSQGCSSCPPADKLLEKYAARDDVLALSFHVDYWNYLGWQDTFSHAGFTERQYRYAASFKRRGVYTPQAVINGRTHVVGSRGQEVEGLLQAYRDGGKGLTADLNVRQSDGVVRISSTGTQSATLWLVSYHTARSVDIARGENRGKRITYHNVVRDVSMLGMVKDGVLDISLPAAELGRGDADGKALLLQQTTPSSTPGPIIGAARIKVPAS
ncbi:MAG: DUF1223 domain-containing protein [Pseudomonadota bacterium]